MVEIDQEGAYGGIQLWEGEEGVMAESRQNPALHHLYPHFDFGFVSGAGRAGRDHGNAIVLCQRLVCPIERGLIAVRPADSRLEVIRHQHLRHSPERFEGADMRADPVR